MHQLPEGLALASGIADQLPPIASGVETRRPRTLIRVHSRAFAVLLLMLRVCSHRLMIRVHSRAFAFLLIMLRVRYTRSVCCASGFVQTPSAPAITWPCGRF